MSVVFVSFYIILTCGSIRHIACAVIARPRVCHLRWWHRSACYACNLHPKLLQRHTHTHMYIYIYIYKKVIRHTDFFVLRANERPWDDCFFCYLLELLFLLISRLICYLLCFGGSAISLLKLSLSFSAALAQAQYFKHASACTHAWYIRKSCKYKTK